MYLDDHILHDSRSHFPDLLSALAIAVSIDDKVFNQIQSGMSAAKEARVLFYKDCSRF
jgi:hypothetical protein